MKTCETCRGYRPSKDNPSIGLCTVFHARYTTKSYDVACDYHTQQTIAERDMVKSLRTEIERLKEENKCLRERIANGAREREEGQ